MKQYCVYIVANKARTLYVGVTDDLVRRVYEHKHKLSWGFTSKYFLTRLVYFEETDDVLSAISREKKLKGWRRARKIELIESMNPEWEDLSAGWYEDETACSTKGRLADGGDGASDSSPAGSERQLSVHRGL